MAKIDPLNITVNVMNHDVNNNSSTIKKHSPFSKMIKPDCFLCFVCRAKSKIDCLLKHFLVLFGILFSPATVYVTVSFHFEFFFHL